MMTIQKGLKGQLRVASDKSITHRAIILGAMAAGKTHISAVASKQIHNSIHWSPTKTGVTRNHRWNS